MNLTKEQQQYVSEHLREAEKTYAICSIAKMIAKNSKDINLKPEETELASLIMNIGETNEAMSLNGVSIYSKEYGPWDDKAKELNARKGEMSIEMAENQVIELSQNAKEAIIGASKGGTLNKLAITLKLAQTMEAIKHTRWSRGQQKQPAKDIKEVTGILNDELNFMLNGQQIDYETKEQIKQSMISAARDTYVQEKQTRIKSLIQSIMMFADRELDVQPDVASHVGISRLTEERINSFILGLSTENIDEVYKNIDDIANMPLYASLHCEDELYDYIKKVEKSKDEPDVI